MNEFGKRGSNTNLKSDIGLDNLGSIFWNMSPAELVEDTVLLGEGVLTDSGAIAVNTGTFTGRSPEDRFIVCDEKTENSVWWGKINKKFDAEKFDALYDRMKAYLTGKDVYVRDAYACADEDYRMNIRVVTELPWSNMFAHNMFLRPTDEEIQNFTPEWHVVCAPNFMADPEIDGTRQSNYAVINFTKKMIIIGGTGYTGEIKKGIFSVLNYVLPFEKNVLSMHCSANVGEDGDTAVFFGLSGTGKTTLSSDPLRRLIGDDEHGWADNGSVFNFEGGCYAKTINLSKEKEPQIYDAIKFGAILENIGFEGESSTPDYDCDKITQNTRVSYPIHHIDNIMVPSKGTAPKNIFFLTCDAFGVLPPISKLDSGQAMYHFISGYTAKVAGTEAGITEPQTVFSACFGAPFLPLHPTKYAEMLGEKIENNDVNVWLVNTGWSGGAYGTGSRMKLSYTRSMITAALTGKLDNVEYIKDDIFGLNMPTECEDVPTEILNPVNTWEDKAAFEKKANELAQAFVKNFEIFESDASEEIINAAPKVMVK
ncbi:phosphoenolpyruvate carboxykinase (ATP) [Brumimicrobium aurantiacum]|uniref:Phosphoenolpyruvate carboxykinase (ATP) n=1 Tax=Brumimicrobium aurantiacum TaxID=1737063 RepID=A0A3E1EZA4_9FLAO|nr:phosphoenolpyruvate carboxykinase (ATP) [Brumimicrobium aurantiacum]RFC54901.1 phosphoenolpyruvate carboxykinase (ATP) [Brumimicrobium aurantiacum]